MNRAWAASLSNIWHSTNWLMWLAIIVAVVIVIGLIIAAVRSEGSLARNGVIFVVVMAIGIAGIIAMMRGSGAPVQTVSVAQVAASTSSAAPDKRPAVTGTGIAFQPPLAASLPALACLDGIAGESVENACEKALFASADSTAAAVSYTAAQMSRLASFGIAAAADKAMTPDLNALRRAIERDRYGLVAQVLMTRDGCTSAACPFFPSLTSTAQIAANMNERLYDGLVGRYAPLWNLPAASASNAAPVAALGTPGTPPGRPVSGDFPSASSIPPVNIMTPEPAAQGAQSAPRQPEATAPSARATAPATPKKSSAQKSRAQAPTSLAPAQAADDN